MNGDNAKRSERDGDLVRSFCQAAADRRRRLQEWIQEELKEQRIAAQMLYETSTGVIKDRAKQHEEDLNDLDIRRLPEEVKRQKNRVDDVWSEFDEDPFTDFLYLEESTLRLEKMAMIIFRYRQLLDNPEDNPASRNEGEDPDPD
jgi:hypothetical protein